MRISDWSSDVCSSDLLVGDAVTVSFDGIEGGLVAYGGPYPLGVELCGDTQESCRWALATLSGDTMRITTDGKPATRVRHAWADAPVVNLHDGRGQIGRASCRERVWRDV